MEFTELTPQQIGFFETFGYLALPGLFADAVEEITTAFTRVFNAHGGGHAGKEHEGTARSCIVPFIDQSERLSALLDDPRILTIAGTLLGDVFNYMSSDGNYYVGDTAWHSDGWHTAVRYIKIAFYLDPLTRDTGALRVIPGTHHIGDKYAEAVQAHIGAAPEVWGLSGAEIPAQALETQPGDLVIFNHRLKHASFGGGRRRRMFTINLCQRYPEEHLEALRTHIAHFARYWIDHVYGEKMVGTATPERQRHLEQVMANEGHLPELAQQAREALAEPARG